MQDKTYFVYEIDDENPFAHTEQINCYVHHCFGCALDDALWEAWLQLCPPKDTVVEDDYSWCPF